MKKVFSLVLAAMVLLGMSDMLSAKTTRTKQNNALRNAKRHLSYAARSSNSATIKKHLLKARHILYRDKRSLGGHRAEALKWIRHAMKSLKKRNISMAKRYASKARKQVYRGLLKVEKRKR